KIKITWYEESYISNRRAFVTVENNDKNDVVLDCNDLSIIDINMNNDTIFIKIFEPVKTVIYSFKNSFEGYPIKIDSCYSINEYNKIYQPEYYKPSGASAQ
ncbi:MAG: hypothetical protein ACQUYJ_09605, partial [Ferruginibacter sp.]